MKIVPIVLAVVFFLFASGCTCSCKKGDNATPTNADAGIFQLRVEIKDFQDATVVKKVWQKIKDGANGNYQVTYELQLTPTYVTLVLSSSLPGTVSLKKTLHNMLQNDAVRLQMAGDREMVILPE